MTFPCVDTDHFDVDDNGVLSPQPWMQWRPVATIAALSKSVSYGVTGGANKNELIHLLKTSWYNDSPIPQWCYGLVTRGGCRVTLQARSRGYLIQSHGQRVGARPHTLHVSSTFGSGVDPGKAGLLGIGTGFCVAEVRMNTVTIPLMPMTPGWNLLSPGEELFATVELRFVTEVWESTLIDGGDQGTESSWLSGDTRLDLFAVPALGDEGVATTSGS